MPGCASVNCSNHSNKGFRLFTFPRDSKRRAKWVQNCRRDNWEPTSASRLCEKHFEDFQFEQNRADGKRKLKPNAVPTIFDVPNPPSRIQTKRPLRDRNIPREIHFDSEMLVESTSSTSHDNVPMYIDDEIPTTSHGISLDDENTENEITNLKRKLWSAQKEIQRPLKKKSLSMSTPVDQCITRQKLVPDEEPIDIQISINSDVENNALNNLLGSALNSVIKKRQLCTTCIKSFRKLQSSGRVEEILTENVRSLKLNFPSAFLFDTFQLFNVYLDRHLLECTNHPRMIAHLMHFALLCHPVKYSCTNCKNIRAILKTFIAYKINIFIKAKNRKVKLSNRRKYGSKSSYITTLRV